MKTEIFNASIKTGSRELYTTANSSRVTAPHGAFIKISSNETSYKIEDLKSLTIKRGFEALTPSIIRIKGNFDHKINPEDEASIYHDKYEASSVEKILEQEGSYEIGEILYCQGGIVSSSTEDLTGKMCELKVTKTNEEGKVSQIKINEPGVYSKIPLSPVTATNEKEKPITLNLSFDVLDNSSLADRTIASVKSSITHTDIVLSYELPEGVEKGEIIITKQIIILDREYSHQDVYAQTCSIIKDFSPSNKFPLMAPNSPTAHTIFNIAIEMIEQKFKTIEERLKQLEKIKR